jgi:D-serine deaminase-like pyridoxal phosphate-dependent protein
MQITKPTLLLDKEKCKRNIRMMVEKSIKNKVIFRPHFKTHQSAEIGNWFRAQGVNKITVSSVSMAEYFSRNGWNDILIAFPVNLLEIDQINNLAGKIDLQLSVESEYTANFLVRHLKHRVGIYIKIDTGYHRTGIPAENKSEIEKILDIFKQAEILTFKGFYTHAGNTYGAKGKSDVENIHIDSVKQLLKLKNLILNDFPDAIISIGDTPSCSIVKDFEGIDEIRPGNFVFYDLMQVQLGSCEMRDIAVGLCCPVTAMHRNRNEIVIYGGAIHLSKEVLKTKTGQKHYGLVSFYSGEGWTKPLEETWVKSISQEHGIIKTTAKLFNQFEIGKLMVIWPVHSCLTADLSPGYLTLTNEIIDKFMYHHSFRQY